MQTQSRPVRLPERLAFRCSTRLAEAIRQAAEEEDASPSDLVRRIVNERLVAGARPPTRVAA
jgi:hypothetical protein